MIKRRKQMTRMMFKDTLIRDISCASFPMSSNVNINSDMTMNPDKIFHYFEP